MDINPLHKGKGTLNETKLKNEWCIWERYQSQHVKNKNNYKANNEIIFQFSTLE